MNLKRTLAVLLLLVPPFAGRSLYAADGTDKEPSTESAGKDSTGKDSAVKDSMGKDKSRMPSDHEAAALGFVLLNHPDLVEVLNRLKASNHAEYEKAIKQIHQTSERLGKLSKDDPDRHDAELRLWKVDSRLQLLAARISVNSTSAANEELKLAVREEFDAKADLLALERKRQAVQLKKVDAELTRLNQGRDKEIDARLNEIKKEIVRMKHKSKTNSASSSTTPSADSKGKPTP